jgi:predicted enzyme related to lactoylglutathione lyase
MFYRAITFLSTFTVLLAISAAPSVRAEEIGFTKTTIDFGIVVSDLEKSLKFYTEVVGFKRAGNFTVQPDTVNAAGLTNISKPLTIEELTLGDGATATKLKLMQIPDSKQKKPANEYIHSSFGMSYMTVFVTDTKAALARAAKHNVKPLKKGPVAIGGGKIFLTLLKDPDGNFIELVGPSK